MGEELDACPEHALYQQQLELLLVTNYLIATQYVRPIKLKNRTTCDIVERVPTLVGERSEVEGQTVFSGGSSTSNEGGITLEVLQVTCMNHHQLITS